MIQPAGLRAEGQGGSAGGRGCGARRRSQASTSPLRRRPAGARRSVVAALAAAVLLRPPLKQIAAKVLDHWHAALQAGQGEAWRAAQSGGPAGEEGLGQPATEGQQPQHPFRARRPRGASGASRGTRAQARAWAATAGGTRAERTLEGSPSRRQVRNHSWQHPSHTHHPPLAAPLACAAPGQARARLTLQHRSFLDHASPSLQRGRRFLCSCSGGGRRAGRGAQLVGASWPLWQAGWLAGAVPIGSIDRPQYSAAINAATNAACMARMRVHTPSSPRR